jgi:hypothetical protein
MCTIPPSLPALLIPAISRSTLRALEDKANHVAPLVHHYNVESPTDRIIKLCCAQVASNFDKLDG